MINSILVEVYPPHKINSEPLIPFSNDHTEALSSLLITLIMQCIRHLQPSTAHFTYLMITVYYLYDHYSCIVWKSYLSNGSSTEESY